MTLTKLIPAALAAIALTATVPAAAAHEKGEAKLAKLLDGRVAGKPVHCLTTFQRRNMQVIDRTAFVFRDGDTLYVNRPSGAQFLTWTDVPVFKIWGSDLCDKDFVHLRDSSTWMPGATLSMGDFVPYRRAG